MMADDTLVVRTLDPASWRRTASELLNLWQTAPHITRRSWQDTVESYLGDRTDYVVVRGMAKVLSDAATFDSPETVLAPNDLRMRLFSSGPAFEKRDLFHPQTRQERLQMLADELDTSVNLLETALFADLSGAQMMTDPGRDWTPDGLVARYNLELSRGVLYWASWMQVDVYDTFKDFWRYLKLFKLMFEAYPIDGGYHVVLDGPISPFVRTTTRYGRQFAAFLPALLLCERWNMTAEVRLSTFDQPLTYSLNHESPLTSHFARSGEFDSRLEADFAAEFQAKFGDERARWLLGREDEVLLLGETVMIPDFSLTHKTTGQRVLIEIVGFWHPAYLKRKLEKVRAANRTDILLLIYEGVNLSNEALEDVPAEVLYFKNKPVLKDVMAAVQRMSDG